MLSRKNKNVSPPCGYIWKDPDTGTILRAGVFFDLAKQAKHHRKINQLDPIEDIEDQIEHYIALHCPEDMVEGDIEKGDQTFAIHGKDVYKVMEALYQRWRMKGRGLASPNQVHQRAATCCRGFDGKKCPHNISTRHSCWDCSGIANVVWTLFGFGKQRRLAQYPGLHVCAICKCELQTLVQLNTKIIKEITSDLENYPEGCWKREELEKDNG